MAQSVMGMGFGLAGLPMKGTLPGKSLGIT